SGRLAAAFHTRLRKFIDLTWIGHGDVTGAFHNGGHKARFVGAGADRRDVPVVEEPGGPGRPRPRGAWEASTRRHRATRVPSARAHVHSIQARACRPLRCGKLLPFSLKKVCAGGPANSSVE